MGTDVRAADAVRDNKYGPDLIVPCSAGQASVAAADDADGAEANAAFCVGYLPQFLERSQNTKCPTSGVQQLKMSKLLAANSKTMELRGIN